MFLFPQCHDIATATRFSDGIQTPIATSVLPLQLPKFTDDVMQLTAGVGSREKECLLRVNLFRKTVHVTVSLTVCFSLTCLLCFLFLSSHRICAVRQAKHKDVTSLILLHSPQVESEKDSSASSPTYYLAGAPILLEPLLPTSGLVGLSSH